MLRFIWNAAHPGAPDTDAYRRASDALLVRSADGTDRPVQSFPCPDDGPAAASADVRRAIDAWLAEDAPDRVVFAVHGYDFDPSEPDRERFDDDPYSGVFRDVETDDGVSWIPICNRTRTICFAWTSRPRFTDAGRACWTNTYEYCVQDLAVRAARALSMLIAAVRERGVAIDVFAHSLGTRVAVKTLGRIAAQPGSSDAVRRAVLLGGAEYSIDALAATRSLSTDCYNFVIRGDWVLRKGASEMGGRNRPPNTMRSRVIGRDGMKRAPHWIDFQLDHTDDENAAVFRSWFERLGGYQVSGERIAGRGEHWAYYLHPGNRALYCAILEEEGLTVDWMRRNGAPDGVDRFQYDSLRGTPPKTPMTCRGRRRLYGWEA